MADSQDRTKEYKKAKKEYKKIRKDWDALKSGSYKVFKTRYKKNPNDSMVTGHDNYETFKEHADIELRAGGGMIRKYKTGGSANVKGLAGTQSGLKPQKIKKSPELKMRCRRSAKGGMIKKYNIGGDVRSNKTKKSNNVFKARGCGRVMNNRRKKTTVY